MDILITVLSFAVLAALVVTLLFVTKAFKAKGDEKAKRQNLIYAGITFFIYLALNALRLYAEGQIA